MERRYLSYLYIVKNCFFTQISLKSDTGLLSYGQKWCLIWLPSAIFNFTNYSYLVTWLSLSSKCTFVCAKFHQNQMIFRLDIAILRFAMAAVCHLEFSKFRVIITWPIYLSIIMLFCFTDVGQSGAELWPKIFLKWRPFAKNFHILSSGCYRVSNVQSCTQFHQNRMTFRCDMAISRFSRWRISAILNFMGPIMGSLKSPRHIS